MQEVLTTFKALSDAIRLRILKLLENGELCVCDIVAALDMPQPKVSFHLAALKDAGLITDRKQGRWMLYRINPTDLFARFLLVSALERVQGESVTADKERLEAFLKAKMGMIAELPSRNCRSCVR